MFHAGGVGQGNYQQFRSCNSLMLMNNQAPDIHFVLIFFSWKWIL
ncbi:MAG: hypothetical protein JWM28_1243 [Chitinophagaceae bacterium]|nr:hypothetical protein [Chitinophagaceae bacterium]